MHDCWSLNSSLSPEALLASSDLGRMNSPLSPLDLRPASSQAPPSDASAQWGLGNPALHSASAERRHRTLVEASGKLSLTVESPGTPQERTVRRLSARTPAAERKLRTVSPPRRPDFNDIAVKAVGTVSHPALWSPDGPPRWPRGPAWHQERTGAPGGWVGGKTRPASWPTGFRGVGCDGVPGPAQRLAPCELTFLQHLPARAPQCSARLAVVQLNTKHLAPFQHGCQDLASRELQGSSRLLNPFTFLIRSTHPCL